MVHALREAHRVLKPGGKLIDLRPAPKHRRVGIGTGKNWQSVGVMREKFDDDLASNRAVAEVLRAGLFRRESRVEYDLDRVMDDMQDFREWLQDFADLGRISISDRLLKRLEAALKQRRKGTKIVVRGPLMLGVMGKLGE